MLNWLKALLGLFGRSAGARFDDVVVTLEGRLQLAETRLDDCEKNHREERDRRGECEERLNILESTVYADAVIVCDKAGVVVDWNGPAHYLFHRQSSEMVGKSVSAIIPIRYRGEHLAAFASVSERMSRRELVKLRTAPLHTFGLTREGSEVPVTVRLNAWYEGGELRIGATIRRRADRPDPNDTAVVRP